ncbi:hypothetical protein [Phenylobacterium sp.]|uniref:hypothetical protein n=1 Tax=Phenylobacterium sp. TaxID=1871053 RepID=UPI0035B4B29D
MRLNLKPTAHHANGEHHHENHHRIERFEGAADMLVVGLIILFGVAMVIGLITASGNVTW